MSPANSPRTPRAAAVTVLAAGGLTKETRESLARSFQSVEVVDLDLPSDHAWSSCRAEINRAILAASHEWVLLLRAGESIPRELGQHMRSIITSDPVAWAYRVDTELLYRGKPLNPGNSAAGEIRLFHAKHCRFDLRSESAVMKAEGPVRRLPVPLVRVLYESADAHRSAVAQEGTRAGLSRLGAFARAAVIDRGAFAGWNALVYLWIESARQSVSDR